MGLKLRRLAATFLSPVGTASTTASASDAYHAVLRATAHHPSTAPPSAHHLDALLAFGRGSRLSAAALASALTDRLHGHGDAAVALKALVALRILLARGAFILRDQILAALVRHPASGRNPLALAAFPLGRSFATASWVRFSARLLEVLLLLPDPSTSRGTDAEYLAALPNPCLVSELASFASVVAAVRQAPPPSCAPQRDALIWEAIRLAEEDRVAAERNLAARVREMGERLDTLVLADAMELVCVLKRVEETSAASPAPEWKWAGLDESVVAEARRLRERAEEVLLRLTERDRRLVRREPKASASARVVMPVRAGHGYGYGADVRFGSSRWAGTVSSSWR
ncbi:putative clathrin assembly protein At4g40080 [Brachypodium distachyon]|uniref:ENTH domain-containing protein n=1 Tax=Brachypodium distachyon TaxID=15368 RepID=A0A0Q3LDE3_BRADI|nr:putative clathrin assembly protein At4g40080 [Brachypodium distachyon]KQJ90581.1 hypothetical protein BRADI_4g32627v3 [Brachypodium distachyon]|eukprot:XP_003576626.1 putative clathrin assembly protein At4g40080 [Brachypodium distachyon]